ncbi:DUF202 domain-containing protein [Mycolicibacterium thermoresistibile]
MSRVASDSGLQAERTALSWTRTSLAVLANGALLLLRDVAEHPLGLAAVGVSIVVAAGTYWIGQRRQLLLAEIPLPPRVTPVREVYLLTAAVLVLIAVSVVSLPY